MGDVSLKWRVKPGGAEEAVPWGGLKGVTCLRFGIILTIYCGNTICFLSEHTGLLKHKKSRLCLAIKSLIAISELVSKSSINEQINNLSITLVEQPSQPPIAATTIADDVDKPFPAGHISSGSCHEG